VEVARRLKVSRKSVRHRAGLNRSRLRAPRPTESGWAKTCRSDVDAERSDFVLPGISTSQC